MIYIFGVLGLGVKFPDREQGGRASPSCLGGFWWLFFPTRVGRSQGKPRTFFLPTQACPEGPFLWFILSQEQINVVFIGRSAGQTPGEAVAAGTALLLLPPSAFIYLIILLY